LYLEHQESGVVIGEIEFHHFNDQILILRNFVKSIGPNRLVSDISTIKAMYNWAIDNEVINNIPNLKAIKKVVILKPEKPTFTASQIQKLLENTSAQMRAMILFGLNCGFGRTDCAKLRWGNLDLKNSRVSFHRGKTGIDRNLPLWPETVATLKQIPKSGELVFHTSKENP